MSFLLVGSMDNEKFGSANIGEKGDQISKKYALIDGLNGAFSRNDGKARLGDLLSISRTLKDEFDYVEIIADASARHKIDNKIEFERLIRDGRVQLCPAGVDGDDLIWIRAKSLTDKGHVVTIVSNDMFPIRRARIEKVSVSSMVVSIFPDGQVYFLERSTTMKDHHNPSTGGTVQLIEIEK